MNAALQDDELDDELQARIAREFAGVSDYIWKAPRLIEHEAKLERRKLETYFPDSPELRELRWRLESENLDGTFPYMIAVGNLLSVASLYESYLLLIASLLDRRFDLLKKCSGQGQSRIHAFFKSVGVKYSALDTYAAVDAAISIRNCIAHCSGVLDWSRDTSKLRDLVGRGRYLSREHLRRRQELGADFHEVRISQSFLGDRLEVDNLYAHLVCTYFRDHLVSLVHESAVAYERTG